MKMKEKDFIRELISSDFKHISNPGFTHETLEKISELEDSKKSYSSSGDKMFLIPQIIYASLFILLSLISGIISWIQFEQKDNIIYSIDKISEVLLNPVTISILFSFSLLYLIDLYLKKTSTRLT
jgi:hypothetical protein